MLHHLAAETRGLQVMQKGFAHRGRTQLGNFDRGIAAEGEMREQIVDERGIVLRDNATSIAGLVVQRGVLEREAEVHRELGADVRR